MCPIRIVKDTLRKMEYGINIRYFSRDIGMERAAELVARAGFSCLDYTPPVSADDWEATLRADLAVFRSHGLHVHQTHAPFGRYVKDPDYPHRLYVERCAEATALLGAEFMVVHGDEFDFASREFSPEAALSYNHDLFLPYVERGRREGYRVAFETVFEDWDRRRYTSSAEELLSLVDSFGSEAAVICWDFGHSNIAFRKAAPDRIREFGSRIACTHLHDNAGVQDSHAMPLTMDIPWRETMAAFAEIGYGGVLSVEYAHGRIPEAAAEDFLRLTYRMTDLLSGYMGDGRERHETL